MTIWTEPSETDKKRVHAAAEYEGVSAFVDTSLRDALRVAVGLCTTLGVLRAHRRYERKMRKKYGYK